MVIFSGDCSNIRDPYRNENEVRNFIEWFAQLSIKYKIFVAGNHDSSIESKLITKDDFKLKDIYYLENETIEIEGLKIFGSPITPTFGNWCFMKARTKLDKLWANVIEDDVDILVTHGPPKTILDLAQDRMRNLEFCGDKSLLNKVVNVNPKLHCFGHIHNNEDIINRGTRTIEGLQTIFSNASMVKDRKFGDLNSQGNGNIIEIQ